MGTQLQALIDEILTLRIGPRGFDYGEELLRMALVDLGVQLVVDQAAPASNAAVQPPEATIATRAASPSPPTTLKSSSASSRTWANATGRWLASSTQSGTVFAVGTAVMLRSFRISSLEVYSSVD